MANAKENISINKNEVCDKEVAQQEKGKTSTLNPNAAPWYPKNYRGREDDRSIYITFSRGNPLSEFDLLCFFSSKYGHCVDDIFIHKPSAYSPPLFGKIEFKTRSTVAKILGDQDEVHYTIGTKSLWCKRYKKNRDKASGGRSKNQSNPSKSN